MAFGKHYEWRGFGSVTKHLRVQIESLEKMFGKDDKGRHEVDHYLWASGTRVNVKVRGSALKIKRLTGRTSCGLDEWLEDETENFPFPLSPKALATLNNIFGSALTFPDDLARSSKELLNHFSSKAGDLKVITIEKQRIQYKASPKNELISVELAEIIRPSTTTIGLESKNAEAIVRFLDETGLRSNLTAMDYLTFIEQNVQNGLGPRC